MPKPPSTLWSEITQLRENSRMGEFLLEEPPRPSRGLPVRTPTACGRTSQVTVNS